MQRIGTSYQPNDFLDHLDIQTRDLVFKMIGEIYGSKVNHSPITACIFRLKSLRWKLVSILFDCTLQLWLTAHYKVLSWSGRVLSGPSRISLTKIQRTSKIPWRDTGFDCSSLEAGFAQILAKNAFFGKENSIRDRDDWSSRCGIVVKKKGECVIMIRLPRQTPVCIQLCGQVMIRSQSQNRLTGNTCFRIIAVWFL